MPQILFQPHESSNCVTHPPGACVWRAPLPCARASAKETLPELQRIPMRARVLLRCAYFSPSCASLVLEAILAGADLAALSNGALGGLERDRHGGHVLVGHGDVDQDRILVAARRRDQRRGACQQAAACTCVCSSACERQCACVQAGRAVCKQGAQCASRARSVQAEGSIVSV